MDVLLAPESIWTLALKSVSQRQLGRPLLASRRPADNELLG